MPWWAWFLVGVVTGGLGFIAWFAWYFRDVFN